MARSIAVIRGIPRTIAGCVTIAALYGICVFAVVRKPGHGGTTGLVVIGLIAAIAVVRIARSGVVVTEEGIVIRNWLRSYSLPWSRITAFSPASDDDRHHSVGVWTVDGARISCSALTFLGGFTLAGPSQYPELAANNAPGNQLADYVERAKRLGRLGHPIAAG